jgi:hypothetical protein
VEGRVRRAHAHRRHLAARLAANGHQHRQLHVRRPLPLPFSAPDPVRSFYYPPGKTGNEIGESDPVFMRKHGAAQAQDTGKWIDSSVWHGKAHTWAKLPWVIKEVCFPRPCRHRPGR